MIVDFNDENNWLQDGIDTLMEDAARHVLAQELCGGMEQEKLEEAEAMPLYISVTTVDLEEIREINRDYRGIDKSTDVLSFPQYEDKEDILAELEDEEELLEENVDLPIGDVVLCYDQAVIQSQEYGTTLKRELIYLFVHSMLHLMGYDHMEEDEKKVMRAHEETVMEALGIGRA